jgi:hypothetical protein
MNTQQSISTLLAQALQQMLALATGGDDLPAITLPAAASATAPAVLARGPASGHLTGKGRPQPYADKHKLYTRCLALYRERVQGGADTDDLGRAAALFVMANLSALGRQGGDAQTLDALTQQMQNALQRLPDWPATPLAAQQQMFEQLALLSVLVTQSAEAAAQQGQLARANVRAAAQAYLRQWLAVDPALLSLSPAGLVVAPGAFGAFETLANQVNQANRAHPAHKALAA